MSILIDSNVLIAAYHTKDSLHEVSLNVLEEIEQEQKIINYFILSEIASVLLLKTKNISFVKRILQDSLSKDQKDIVIDSISKKLLQTTLTIFSSQDAHKLSLADCSIIAQAELQDIKNIATFDEDLRKSFEGKFHFLPGEIKALLK